MEKILKDQIDKHSLIIDAQHLKKSLNNREIIKDLSLQIKRGEIFGFLGPNGSGKTTTIRMLCGLLTPDSGSGHCMGFDIIKERLEIKYHVGYVPQAFGLYLHLTVYENLMMVAKLYGLLNREEKIDALIEQLRLTPYKNRIASHLSGGWKQILSLAAALVHEPFILLLDEPTTSMDSQARNDFWELIHNLAAGGTTIMLSSHSMDEVVHCHRISFLDQGTLVFCGSIEGIIKETKLLTWSVRGENLPLIARQLKLLPGIEQVITLYGMLHVSGRNRTEIEEAIKPFIDNPNYQWEETNPTVQDIFIWLSIPR